MMSRSRSQGTEVTTVTGAFCFVKHMDNRVKSLLNEAINIVDRVCDLHHHPLLANGIAVENNCLKFYI